jgi:uncharacterized membrane protein
MGYSAIPVGIVTLLRISMNGQRRPLVQIVGFVTGLLLLGIGLYTGMNGAIAIGLILATLNAVIWMRDRNAKQPE